MSIYYKLNDDKTISPCSLVEWGEQIKQMWKTHTKHLGMSYINGLKISTVWLGLNHNHFEDSNPLVFETMVFDKNDCDVYCDRYSTYDDALEGHKRAIEWVKNGASDNEERIEA